MSQDLYITASACIRDGKAIKDGELILESISDTEFFPDTLYRQLSIKYPKFYKMDDLSKLGFLTAEIIFSGRKHETKYQPEQTGIILSNANASLDTDIKYLETMQSIASPAVFVYTLPNIMTGEISIRHKIKGENMFFISPRFSPELIVSYVRMLFDIHAVSACLCGWVDCLKGKYTSLMWLVEKINEDNYLTFDVKNITNAYQL